MLIPTVDKSNQEIEQVYVQVNLVIKSKELRNASLFLEHFNLSR